MDTKTCLRCGETRPITSFSSCGRAYPGLRRNICRACIVKARVARGGCRCGAAATVPGYAKCARCIKRRVAWHQRKRTQRGRCRGRNSPQSRLSVKLEVMTHYCGGKTPYCGCCGETLFAAMQIDHVYGDGASHRKQPGLGGGDAMYRWLRRNGYPDGFQVLCANCNWAKARGLVCPHQHRLF